MSTSCWSGPAAEAEVAHSTAEATPLRERARAIVAGQPCAACHTGSLPTAKSRALAIFDLDLEDWTGTMTTEQLEGLESRLAGALDDADAVVIRELVASEIAKRE